MKFYYSLLAILLVCLTLQAQKKELKAAQKLVDANSFAAAINLLEENSELLSKSEPKYASQYYYLLGFSQQAEGKFSNALATYENVRNVEKSGGMSKYTQLIKNGNQKLIADIVNKAVEFNTNKDYKKAGELLYMAYKLDESNQDYLYYAASSSVNGGDYDVALKQYQKLKELNYTGITTKYYATEVSSNKETEVDETTYNIYKRSKDFTNLREELTPSRLPEVVKNIALIYVNKGDNAAAMAAVKDARKLSPKDVGLILTEADLYIKLGDESRFGILMQEAIAQDPNNAILYYNLGVVNGNQGNREQALEYYKKAIDLDPNYEPTYLNLASIILEGEADIVEQMNSLGTSATDNRKYDALKSKREQLFLEAVPILEKLVTINSNNVEALTTLKNIFGTIGDTANFKKYRDMLESL